MGKYFIVCHEDHLEILAELIGTICSRLSHLITLQNFPTPLAYAKFDNNFPQIVEDATQRATQLTIQHLSKTPPTQIAFASSTKRQRTAATLPSEINLGLSNLSPIHTSTQGNNKRSYQKVTYLIHQLRRQERI